MRRGEPPGTWAEAVAVEAFLADDRLERVLGLYGRAMRLDPDEPAYPWNLASSLNRLGMNDLAFAFVSRAVHLAERAGETEWSGSDVHLAAADIALAAGETEAAILAFLWARDRTDGAPATASDIDAALDPIRDLQCGDPSPLALRLLELSAA